MVFAAGLLGFLPSFFFLCGARVVFAAAFRLVSTGPLLPCFPLGAPVWFLLLLFAWCPAALVACLCLSLLALLGFLPWFGPAASAAVVPVLCAPLGARFQTGLAPAMFKNDCGHFSLV